MSAREKLLDYVDESLVDAYAHELAERQRTRLAAGLRMQPFAAVLCSNGKLEPMGTTHLIDGIDPECGGVNRPAAEALAELRERFNSPEERDS